MSLRDTVFRIGTPWMMRRVFARIRWGTALLLDADWSLLEEGIKLRMPGVGNPEALPYIGNDRQIDRGPYESDATYIERLKDAFDTWKKAGSVAVVLEQLRYYFADGPLVPPIRAVADRGVWHEIDPVTAAITKTVASPSNWEWDAHTGSRWWRGWIIIDSSAGPWTTWQIGTSGKKIGEAGLTIGSTAKTHEVAEIRKRVLKWKPQHVDAKHVIVTFASTDFEATDPPGAPDMPAGEYDNPVNRKRPGCYWHGGM